MTTSRLEAFSDGVFAIAITLLVLNLRLPDHVRQGGVGHALAELWPYYVSFAVSFLTIGIIWINHHGLFDRVARIDRPLMFLNLYLLLTVVVIPFPTEIVARYLRAGEDQHVAAGAYAATLELMALAFFLIWQYLSRRPQLIVGEMADGELQRLTRRNSRGLLPYAAALGLAFVSAPLSLGICGGVALFYALPSRDERFA